MADKYRWPIGNFFTKYHGWIITIGYMTLISGVISVFYYSGFLLAILYLLLSFLGTGVLFFLFKHKMQLLSILILIISAIVWIAGGTEVVVIP